VNSHAALTLSTALPTAPQEVQVERQGVVPLEGARALTTKAIEGFLTRTAEYHGGGGDSLMSTIKPSEAIAVTTGVGKTHALIEAVKPLVGDKTIRADKPLVFMVPTLKLANEAAARFLKAGVSTKVFRGREAKNPQTGTTMCDDVEAVQLMVKSGQSVRDTTCRFTDKNNTVHQCPFFNTCAYQQQKEEAPAVWVMPAPMCFLKRNGCPIRLRWCWMKLYRWGHYSTKGAASYQRYSG